MRTSDTVGHSASRACAGPKTTNALPPISETNPASITLAMLAPSRPRRTCVTSHRPHGFPDGHVTRPTFNWRLLGISLLCLSLTGCSSHLRWVAETRDISPACIPNRLPTWDDFSRKNAPAATPSAQTAIRFLLNDSPPYLIAKFDHEYSWVKPQSADPTSPADWIASEKLLAHEQVHFLISCLLIRQANHALQPDEDPQKMLELVKSVAQRINVQYDQDTKHGTDDQAQMNWETHVQEQFEDVTSQP